MIHFCSVFVMTANLLDSVDMASFPHMPGPLPPLLMMDLPDDGVGQPGRARRGW